MDAGQRGVNAARTIRQQIEALQRWDVQENDGNTSAILIDAATLMARVERMIRERRPTGLPLEGTGPLPLERKG